MNRPTPSVRPDPRRFPPSAAPNRRRPAPLATRLARARMVLLRRRDDPFGWLSLCLVLVLGGAGLAAVPGHALAGDARSETLLLVPRTGVRLAVDLRPGAAGPEATTRGPVPDDLAANDLVCIQEGARPLAWYRVLHTGAAGPVRAGALILGPGMSARDAGAGEPVTVVALPVAPPGSGPGQPSTSRARRNPR